MSVRLLIDARKLGHGGIGTYIENLVDGLLQLHRAGEIDVLPFLLVDPSELRREDSPLPRWRTDLYWIEEPYRGYSLREYLFFSLWHKKLLGTVDIFHTPHYTLPFGMGLRGLGSRVFSSLVDAIPCVATVHDGIHLSHPESLLHRLFAKPLIRSTLKRATRTITVSVKSSDELSRRFSPAFPISVIPNSVSADSVSGELRDSCMQILYLGSDRPHKGGANAMRMLKLIKDSSQGPCPRLLMVGGRYSESFKRLAKNLGLEEQVEFCGHLSTAALEQRYRDADVLLVSSLVEGFSIPALEALGRGIPLLSTPLPCVQEFAAEAAWWSEDFSAEALKDAFMKLSSSADKRRQRSAEGRMLARQYTPVVQARKSCAVYQEALNEKAQAERAKSRSEKSAKLIWCTTPNREQRAVGGRQ